MGDTLMTTHRLHFQFLRGAAAMLIKNWAHCTDVLQVQMSDQQIGKSDSVNTRLEWFEPDELTNEGFADKALASSPSDFPVAAYPANLITRSIMYFGQARRELSPAFAVPFGRQGLSQCFVRTFVIVAPQPTCAAVLLAAPCVSSGLGGFSFQDPMKLFVRSILLWTGRPDQFDADAQPDPPGAQLRKPCRALRGKGTAIVDPNDLRQASSSKKSCKNRFDRRQVLRGQQLHQQTITTEQIAHCQRLAPLAIACAKPALEIDRPDMVGPARRCQCRIKANPSFARASTLGMAQFQAPEPAANGSFAGRQPASSLKMRPHFLRPPRGVLSADLTNPFDPNPFQLTRALSRTSAAILQGPPSLGQKTSLPLVRGFATDAKNPTAPFDRLFVSEQHLHQTPPLPNYRWNFPRHSRRKTPLL